MSPKPIKCRKGVAVQTEFIHGGSFVRISDELFATSHWPLRKVEIGDEIALFTQSTKADSFIVGEIVSIIECKNTNPRRFTFIFRAKPGKTVSRKVKGAKDASFIPLYDGQFGTNFLFSVWSYGRFDVEIFAWMQSRRLCNIKNLDLGVDRIPGEIDHVKHTWSP